MAEIDEQSLIRREKVARFRSLGIDPYPARYQRTMDAATAIRALEAAEASPDGEPASGSVAGRIVSSRLMGKLCFAHLLDWTGRIQVAIRRDVVGEELFERWTKLIDL